MPLEKVQQIKPLITLDQLRVGGVARLVDPLANGSSLQNTVVVKYAINRAADLVNTGRIWMNGMAIWNWKWEEIRPGESCKFTVT